MKDYFLSKLSIINYRISIHEGDANRRLTSQAVEIYHKLFLSEVPDEYKRDFDKLLKLIKKTLNDSGDQCLHPVRLNGIRSFYNQC